jgi:inositol transporter-like SP family MFS transporter
MRLGLPVLLAAGLGQVQRLVDRAWSRRERWSRFATFVNLANAYHPDDGRLPAVIRAYVAQNMLQVLVWGCTVLATYFGFMRYADRMSQRRLYIIGAALGIVGWIVLVAFTDRGVPTMLTFAVLWGISAGIGAQAFYSLWASELFATPYRASAQGVMFFVVRTVTGLLSYFFPTLLAVTGLTGVGLLLVGLLTVALVIGAIWAPRTQGKTLKQIEVERYGAPVEETTVNTEAVSR